MLEVSIRDLSMTYSRGKRALAGINMEIKPGVFGLLGPNGAGKSTLLKILSTIIRPTAGRVDIGTYSLPRQQHKVRSILGYLPQVYGLFENLSAEEFLEYIALMKGIKSRKLRKKETDKLLRLVHLENSRQQRISTFSGGMRQRLAIAQALVGSPPFLVLDEPTVGLDPEERLHIRNFLSSFSGEGRLIILSTHIVADISAICEQVAVIHEGRLLFVGGLQGLAEKAAGKVWQVRRKTAGAAVEENYSVDDYSPNFTVSSGEVLVSSRRENGHFLVRLLAMKLPSSEAVPAIPTVEDGYVALVSGVSKI